MAGAFEANGTNTGAAAPDADLRAIWRLLWAKKALIIAPALLAAAAALFIAGSMTPMYRSSAQILVERNDTVYTRPEGATASEIREADELAVQSQVQLLLSRDIGRQVVEDLKLAETDEFAPGSQGVVKRILSLIGLSSARLTASPDEQVLDHFFKNLSVYSVPTSRVIVVEFISSDPDLAARAANTLAERYLETQQTVKQTTTRKASGWLAAQIEELSAEVEKAEARVEKFRSGSNLFIGNNNATITNQQLGELSSELARARATQADAQAKAQLLKEVVASGRAIESLDVANSELLRDLSRDRVTLAASIAREGLTYLPGHPRMKELQAQLSALDGQIRNEALKLARAYENEADVAAGRVASVQASIDAQKKVATDASGQEVQLRALEREAKAQRDLLEQFLARYRDAAARERVDATPPDARIISRASPTNEPYAPKPLAITILAGVAVFVLMVVGVTASEFMVVPANGVAAPPSGPLAPSPSSGSGETSQGASPPPSAPPAPHVGTQAAARAVPPGLAAAAASAAISDPPPVFGKLAGAQAGAPIARQVEIEAADMRMLADLAAHLAAMPKSADGALNILTLAPSSDIDPGSVALSLARALAGAGRKAIVVDAGSGSREFAAALPNPGEGGLGELIAGQSSFGQAIQRDRASAAHLIAPGAAGLLNASSYGRINVVFDALGLTYDFVVVLAPSAEHGEDMKTLAARTGAAILVANVQDHAATAAHDALAAAGVSDIVLLLTEPAPARSAERAS